MAILDMEMRLHHETAQAVLVSDDGEEKNAVWLPLSQIELERLKNARVIVTLPEWLALDKGLI